MKSIKQNPDTLINSPTKEFKTLDSLRAIYCIFVVLLHYKLPNLYFLPLSITNFIDYFGKMGVDGFFCLSGFIITHCYQKKIGEALKLSPKQFFRVFLKYFVNRIARLYPLIFFAETMTIIINREAKNCLYEYFLVCAWFDKWNGNTPLWSLGAEFTMYILFPLFLLINLKLNKENKVVWNIALSLFIPIIFNITRLFYDYPNDFFPIFNAGPLYRGIQGFYIGVCMYKIYEKYPNNNYIFDFISLFLLIATCLIVIYCSKVFSYVYVLFLFNLFLVKSDSFMKFIFEREILKTIGDISFTIYLLHYPIIIFLNEKIGNLNINDNEIRFMIFIGFSGFILVLSLLVYHYYECPLRKYFRRKWDEIDKMIYENKTDDRDLFEIT